MLMTKEATKKLLKEMGEERIYLYSYNTKPNGIHTLVRTTIGYGKGNFIFWQHEGFFKERKMTWEDFVVYLEEFPVYDNEEEAYEAMKEEALKYLD